MKIINIIKHLYVLLLLAIVFISCNQYHELVKPADDRKITSFKFLKSDNPGLSQDYEAKITEGVPYIELELPAGTDLTALVPSIEFVGGRFQPNLTDSNGNKRSFDFSVGFLTFAIINDDAEGVQNTLGKTSAIYNIDVYTSGGSSNQEKEEKEEEEKEEEEEEKDDDSRRKVTEPINLAYFPTWDESWLSNGNSKLRQIPSYVNTVLLSFAKPNMRYKKSSFDITDTGLRLPYNGATLYKSLQVLRKKGIKIILSVGGKTHWGTGAYDIKYDQIKDFIDDFEIDGIDWDFEPDGGFQKIGNEENINRYVTFITKTREIMSRPRYIVSCTPSGIGALGGKVNDDKNSPYNYAYGKTLPGVIVDKAGDNVTPAGKKDASSASLFGFESTGHMIPVLKEVGNQIDFIVYQGYNVGGSKDRKIMYDAWAYYAKKYEFHVVAGTHVQPEPWGPYYHFKNDKIAELAQYVRSGGKKWRKERK